MPVLRQNFFFKNFIDSRQLTDVKAGVPVGTQQRHHQWFDGGMGGPEGIRRHTGVNNVHPGLDGLEMAHRRHARCEMTVQVDRRFDRLLQGLDNGIGVIGRYQPGHILDADAVGAHGLEVFSLVDIIVDVINLSAHSRFGHGIADAALKMLAALLDDRNHRFKIAVVIQGIKSPENVHTVGGRPVDKGPGNIVGVVAITHQVLCSEQHRERRLFNITLQCPDAFPGVLV